MNTDDATKAKNAVGLGDKHTTTTNTNTNTNI